MKSQAELNQAFLSFIRQPHGRWDIVEGACWLAAQEYPGIDLKKIDLSIKAMIESLRGRLTPGMAKTEQLDQLNRFFFGEMGFKGNAENYGDPRNSYLPDVLERKLGIPISLSLVYLKLAWETGMPLFGINFPGHFLVVWKESEVDIEKNLYIDVFNGGKLLGPEELSRQLAAHKGREIELEPVTHLRNAGVREILHRMLANLKVIHASNDRLERALWTADWMILLKPQDWDSLRDKGMFCFALGRLDEAEKALVEYLEKTGKPPDFAQVWKALYAIRAQNPASLN